MKNYKILDGRMVKSSGDGQYKVEVSFMYEGKIEILKTNSTGSELFDKGGSLADAQNTIEVLIEEFIDNKFIDKLYN